MKVLSLDQIVKKKNIVSFFYTVPEIYTKYFVIEKKMMVEYDFNIEEIPDSILAIPFVCNVLPIVWLFDLQLEVKELDKDFLEHLSDVKKGYAKMYPMLSFQGSIRTSSVVNKPMKSIQKTACFFSGGVDAYTTLFRHIEEKPLLLTIWGADVKLKEEEGWKNVIVQIEKVAEKFSLQNRIIKSNFREVIEEGNLCEKVKISGDNWWHGFQCGIGIFGLVAPVSFYFGLEKIYIASTYSISAKGNYTSATDPSIDNYVRFCKTKIIHDGYEWDRQEKIRYLLKRKEEKKGSVFLRVCWRSTEGKNCCRCEKCYRTILEIVSEKGDPNEWGFYWKKSDMKRCKRDLKEKMMIEPFDVNQWYLPIKENMIKNKEFIKDYKNYHWIEKLDFNKFNDFWMKRFRRSKCFKKIQAVKNHVKHVFIKIKYRSAHNIETRNIRGKEV